MRDTTPGGMEKRGVVAFGWTPPAGSNCVIKPGQTYRECKEAAEKRKQGNLDSLEADLAKRLSDGMADALG